MFANNSWFRGVSLIYGPDGAVYVSDWCDFGECHDRDGIHRSSGRIYRISYGDPSPVPGDLDLSALSYLELLQQMKHKNHWYRRTARREFQNKYLHDSDAQQNQSREFRAAYERLSQVLETESTDSQALENLLTMVTIRHTSGSTSF